MLHRRAGKTTAVINHHQRAATDDAWERSRLRHLQPDLTDAHLTELLRGRFYAHILPTYRQAKLTTWDMLKYYAAPIPGAKPNEAELSIDYPNGSKLQLFGSDKPDRLRGPAFSGVSFDEYGMHPPNVFSEVISKALADHLRISSRSSASACLSISVEASSSRSSDWSMSCQSVNASGSSLNASWVR